MCVPQKHLGACMQIWKYKCRYIEIANIYIYMLYIYNIIYVYIILYIYNYIYIYNVCVNYITSFVMVECLWVVWGGFLHATNKEDGGLSSRASRNRKEKPSIPAGLARFSCENCVATRVHVFGCQKCGDLWQPKHQFGSAQRANVMQQLVASANERSLKYT